MTPLEFGVVVQEGLGVYAKKKAAAPATAIGGNSSVIMETKYLYYQTYPVYLSYD